VITGIPYFYRRFGYTMAVDLGGHASLPLHIAADPTPAYTPAFTLRPATLDDIADLSKWHDYMARERLLTEIRSVEQWRHELVGHGPKSLRSRAYQIIVNTENADAKGGGEGVGYVELSYNRYNQHVLYCIAYVVGDQSSYLATFDDVTRGIKQWAITRFGDCPTLLYFASGTHDALNTLIE
jgi:hypothetical protein